MKKILELAKSVRLIIFDVDGVLTDGSVHINDDNIQTRVFHIHDGLGMQLLLKSGVEIAIITANSIKVVQHRAQALGIKYLYQGNLDKTIAYDDLLKKLNLTNEQIAYMGDDLPDLPLIRRAALGIAPPNAHELIKQEANWITTKSGGQGAVREVCELILRAQNKLEQIYQEFL